MTPSEGARRFLVTGATGLIGRHVAERLAKTGRRVRILARRPEAAVSLARMGVEVVEGDILERDSLLRVMAGIDVVVHAAALAGEWGARRQFELANVVGMRHVLEAMEEAHVGRLVHLSSVAVYGHRPGRLDEASPFHTMGDPYSDTKIAAEQMLWEHHRTGRIQASALRPVVVYGPYDWKFVFKVAEALRGRGLPLVDGGYHRAQIVSVHDVVDLVLLCATRSEAVGEAFNCVGDEHLTWRQLFSDIARRVEAPAPRFSVPYRLAYGAGAAFEAAYRLARSSRPPLVTRFAATIVGVPLEYDTSKAARLLGFVARRTLSDTMPEALEWWRRERSRAGCVAVG
jgi:nucleoside-diphosphate-sugar epimerase